MTLLCVKGPGLRHGKCKGPDIVARLLAGRASNRGSIRGIWKVIFAS